ncbi:MAG: hypothetical protein M3076_01030 [Actinomycetota bacterium]|nr:hypothetical protein [Actinomycetota bacterium]
MSSGVEIVDVELLVSGAVQDELDRFYVNGLGLGGMPGENGPAGYAVGTARLRFEETADDSAPFYHFALLAPGDRFAEAQRWLSGAASLLSDSDGQTTFDFDFWDAQACYALDPSGNIVEIIAHRGIAESGASGAFDPRELRGVSEVGLVTPRALEAVEALRQAGLPLWSGATEAESLAFCGAKAHTLIVCSPGRGWLPTGRPAGVHPVRAQICDLDRRTRDLRLTRDGVVVVD